MYLTSTLPLPAPSLPRGFLLRPQSPRDIDALADVYWRAYPLGVAAASAEDAHEEMTAVFEGRYGEPFEAASLVALDEDSRVVGCIQTVSDPPWEEAPRGPFIIELFVDPGLRRMGLARALLTAAAAAVHEAGHSAIGLHLDPRTAPEAFILYRDLGFTELS